jgi:CubicO group peptidase (beta-lactamase class C family)
MGHDVNAKTAAAWAELDELAIEGRFSGVVRIDVDATTAFERAYGMAHRGFDVPNGIGTRFGTASGTKAFTALVVMRLVVDGRLALTTTARSLLGDDLALIDDAVTVELLLANRSGIGDYLDEDEYDDVNAYLMPVAVHRLAATEDYVAILDGHPQVSAPGERFAYNNGGFVVLALLAERAAGRPFHDLVDELVCAPAGLHDTAFLRSDETHPGTAVGYLDAEGLRTNVLHLPVLGTGDGGLTTTVADVHTFWQALFAGRIVPREVVSSMVEPRSTTASGRNRYGLGFWLSGTGDGVQLEGMDAGVSFRSVHDRSRRYTYTILSNTTDGAWPLAAHLADRLAERMQA